MARCKSLLANELDDRSTLHGQGGLAAVNHICVMHATMNGCKKKSNCSLKDCIENVNTMYCDLTTIGMNSVTIITNNSSWR